VYLLLTYTNSHVSLIERLTGLLVIANESSN